MVGGAEQGVQQLIETRKKKQEELEAKRAEIDEQLAKEEAIKANIKATEEKQMIQEDQYESLQVRARARCRKEGGKGEGSRRVQAIVMYVNFF